MKRGFLKTSKGAKLTPKQTVEIPYPQVMKLPYGKIAKEDLPNYKPAKLNYSEFHGAHTDYPENAVVYTTLPSQPLGSTLADSPDGWTECIFDGPDAKQIVISTPGFPKPVPKPDHVSHSIKITKTANLGMTATRNLKMGDLVYAERPLLMTYPGAKSAAALPSNTTRAQMIQVALQEWEQLLKISFDRMLPERQAAYLALANSHTEDGSGPIFGVVRTNGFGVTLKKEGGSKKQFVSAVCEILSRINHSCAPNAVVHFDVRTFSSQLRVLRDIKKGEEIFISYCNISDTTAARQEKLAPYGFVCKCARCTDVNSDKTCREILTSVQGLPYGFQMTSGVAAATTALETSLKWLAVIEAEGLQELGAYDDHINVVMRASVATMKVENVINYGQRRSAWNITVTGNPEVFAPLF